VREIDWIPKHSQKRLFPQPKSGDSLAKYLPDNEKLLVYFIILAKESSAGAFVIFFVDQKL